MTIPDFPWRPSPREQRALWWLKNLIIRPIGAAGFLYSLLIKHDVVAIMVSGAMATSVDVGQFVVLLFKTAMQEMKSIEVLAEEYGEKLDEPPADGPS